MRTIIFICHREARLRAVAIQPKAAGLLRRCAPRNDHQLIKGRWYKPADANVGGFLFLPLRRFRVSFR
jgi:hypothetical protein